MADTIHYRFVLRRGLAASWTSQNPILLQGEFGLETDTKNLKIGDGSTAWNSLPYLFSSLVSQLDLQKQTYTAFTTGGTSTAYTLTPSPAITAYTASLSFFVNFNATCGATPTIAISGLSTPPNLVKQLSDGSYANLAAGDVVTNHVSRVTLLSSTQALVERVPSLNGFTGGTLTSALNEAPAVTIASSSTVNIGAAASNIINVTGTTTITAFDSIADGARRTVIFGGILTLTHNSTSLILPTGANITTAAGDVAQFISKGSGNWKCVGYVRADGTALAGAGGGGTKVVFGATPSTNQSIPATTFTKVNFGIVNYDNTSKFNNADSRFQPTTAGYYQINGSANYQNFTSGNSTISIYKNGSEHKRGVQVGQGALGFTVSSLVYLNGSSDYVELWVYVASSNTLLASAATAYFNGFLT